MCLTTGWNFSIWSPRICRWKCKWRSGDVHSVLLWICGVMNEFDGGQWLDRYNSAWRDGRNVYIRTTTTTTTTTVMTSVALFLPQRLSAWLSGWKMGGKWVCIWRVGCLCFCWRLRLCLHNSDTSGSTLSLFIVTLNPYSLCSYCVSEISLSSNSPLLDVLNKFHFNPVVCFDDVVWKCITNSLNIYKFTAPTRTTDA